MIHVFIGTKAQLIKMAPVMVALAERDIKYNFIFSGQHKETIEDLIEVFGVKQPDITLYSGRDITGIGQMFFWAIRIIHYTLKHRHEVWQGDKNGVVLNHGDTFSTLLGSILAKLSGLRSAHIESGLRSHGIFDPFPEELTRILVFKLSDYFFAPGEKPLANVMHYRGSKINTHYNTLIDSLGYSRASLPQTSIDIPEGSYCVASIHRFENIFKRKRLKLIVDMLDRISGSIKVLFILHSPTRVRLEAFSFMNELERKQNVELRPRYDYFSFIRLIEKSEFVITDGGSNQEECYYLGKPCILFRKKTERDEGINKNVLLSNLDWPIIESFVSDHKNYQRAPVTPEISPSKIIINRLVADGLTNEHAHRAGLQGVKAK